MNSKVKADFLQAYGLDKTVDILFEVLDAIPVAVFVKNEKLQKIFANKASLELDERPAAEIIGFTDFDIHTPENAEKFANEDRTTFKEGKVRRKEEFKTRKDGSTVHFLTFKNRIVMDDKTPFLVGASTVTNELHEREQELAASMSQTQSMRQELEETLNAMPLGITLLDKDLNVTLVNDANRKFWNIPLDKDLRGRPFIHSIEDDRAAHPDVSDIDWPAHVKARMDEIRAGNIVAREVPGLNGKTFLYSCLALTAGQRLISFYDITKQNDAAKEVEIAQQKSKKDFADLKSVLDKMRMGLVLLDRDMNIVFVNKANDVLWGWESSSTKSGVPFIDLLNLNRKHGMYDISDENWNMYVEKRQAEIAGGDIAPRELGLGNGITVVYSCTALSDGKRLLSYYDVTEQKKTEKAFQDAEQKAILADRAKSEFLANMSHEIRTPMNGVLGMAELLARTELNSKQKTFTEIIVKSGNALLTIINDILDFSKIDAGQLALDPSPFRLIEAVEEVATLVSAHAREKDLELIVRVAPELPEYMLGDVGRIRQIVTNLMGNAVKFTEHGHVLVEVTGEKNQETGNMSLLFEITDTGVGIPEEKLQSVFDKFSQVDTSSTRRHEGTGLGLAISSKLIALMAGKIGVRSEVGKGSTFWFTIDLPAHGAAKKKKALPFDVQGSRVAIIDDNPVNRSILLEQMRSWNFDSCAANHGREGLAVLTQASAVGLNVDAVVLDYHMPELNGADVARLIRQNPALAHIPIILLTSVDTAMNGDEFNGVYVNAHLMKPARSSLLFDTIVNVIRETRMHDMSHELLVTPMLEAPASVIEEVEAVVVQEVVEVKVEEPVLITEPTATIQSSVDILVAEDNAVNQIVFTQILESLPYSFMMVDNGRKAVEALKSAAPAMILMDVSMPEMNGLEATQAIREHEKATGTKHTPIVGVTAHALKGDRERCMAAGMDDYLTKPISPDMLAKKIETHMGQILQAKSA